MRAVILAAGRGERMGQFGDKAPKCLAELCGKRLIDRQVAALRAGGIASIGVVRGYRADMIDLPGLDYFHNDRWSETNMVASLAMAAKWLKLGPVVVSYADIFFRSELVRELASSAGDLIVAYDRSWRSLWCRRFADPLADAETFRADEMGHLVEIGNRSSSFDEIEGQYIGLLKFTPSAWAAAEAVLCALEAKSRDRLDLTGLLQLLLRRRFVVSTLATSGHWGEIDNHEDLALYERMVRDGELVLDP
jgi:L-glutamine-phosphate cytidylyltransferase